MQNKKRVKPLTETAPTRVSVILKKAMKDRGVSIRDIARGLEMSYEGVRVWISPPKNQKRIVPSDYNLKAVADILGLNEQTLYDAAESDRIEKDYGPSILRLSGKNPELDPIERVWEYLSEASKSVIITMTQTLAKRDRESA